MERGPRLEARDEASHDRHTKGGTAVREVGVGDNMAVDLELPQGHSIVATGGKEEHVPVVVSHPEMGADGKLEGQAGVEGGAKKGPTKQGQDEQLSHGENGKTRERLG